MMTQVLTGLLLVVLPVAYNGLSRPHVITAGLRSIGQEQVLK